MRKEKFVPGEYYHIYNRTILSLPEFKDFNYANKFAQTFLLANSTESGKAFDYLRTFQKPSWKKGIEIALRGDRLVEIVAYAIMPDHYHLLLKELKKNGISDFIRRSHVSIVKHINTAKGRKGSLFEGPFKVKHVDSNQYLLHLSLYIHLNPLDFLDSKNWRNGNLKNWSTKKKKLLEYPWSSLKSFLYKDYDDLILSGTEIILDQFKNQKDYEMYLQEWSAGDRESISAILMN
ncbi:transposase [Patescibacteria group bacterium]